MLKVLFLAAEVGPFVKTGGLGDVVGSLPKELRRQGVDARVMLPKYSDIPGECTAGMTLEDELTVPLAWRRQYCGIWKLVQDGVPVYFLDNEYYFKRAGLYGFADDAERFAFFCRAALEAVSRLSFAPQILHCNDWHTGLVPVFREAFYRGRPGYDALHTVFTIHNLKFQGIYPPEIMADVLGLDATYFTNGLEFYGQVNFLKGGIGYADVVTTVSETYAREIQTPYFGEKLDGLLRERRNDLVGIVNGIDYDAYNPADDPVLFAPFSVRSLAGKHENKAKLQELVGLPVKKDIPVIAMVSRITAAKGFDLVIRVLDDMLAGDIQVVVLGTGEPAFEQALAAAAARNPEKMAVHIHFDDVLAHRIYAGADLLLMPSAYEPCGISQLIAMRYGTLPIVRETGGLKDTVQSYDEDTCQGNGFSFTNYNAHDMLYTVRRAVGLFHQRRTWLQIVRRAMKMRYDWPESAGRYGKLYENLAAGGIRHAIR